MRIKDTVKTDDWQPPIIWALGVAEVIYAARGADLVVTSVCDSKHGEHSLHYQGKAADLRTRGLDIKTVHLIYGDLIAALDWRGFDVVLESDHIHVEYDPKAGEGWLKTVQ